MGMGTGGKGGTVDMTVKYKTEPLQKHLTIEDVRIIERTIEIPVPKLVTVETEQVKFNNIEKDQVKYITKEEETIKFIEKEENTIRYKVIEQQTIQYVPVDKICERPIIQNKVYEKPIIKEVEIEVAKISDLETVLELINLFPKIVQEVKSLSSELETLRISMSNMRSYKLIEEEIKVPQIQYIPTPVERIVWKDVERTRINNAN